MSNVPGSNNKLDELVPIKARLLHRQYPRPQQGEQWPLTLATYRHDTTLAEFASSDKWYGQRTIPLHVKRRDVPDDEHRCQHIKEDGGHDVQRNTKGCVRGDCYLITYTADNDLIPPVTDDKGELMRNADGEPVFDGTRGWASWSVSDQVWEPARCRYGGKEGDKLAQGVTAMYFAGHVDLIARTEMQRLRSQSVM